MHKVKRIDSLLSHIRVSQKQTPEGAYSQQHPETKSASENKSASPFGM